MRYFSRFMLLLAISLLFLIQCNSPTKSGSKSQTLSIADIWWSDAEDYDGDGYYSYAHLNIDIDVSSGSSEIILEIGVRPHDPADTSYYYQYARSQSITIEGSNENDAVYLGMEGLPQSSFDILVLVYKSSDPENAILQALPENDEDLDAIPLELASTDAGLKIYDVFWAEEIDNDGDGYKSEALMGVDLDVNAGSVTTAFVGIFGKLSNASSYELMAVSDTFTVSGNSSNDAVGFRFKNSPLQGSYDFLVEAYYWDGLGTEDQANKNTNPDIGNYLMEPPLEDLFSSTLSYYDGSFENAISYTTGDFTSLNRFVVGFEKPADAGACFIKTIAIRFSDNSGNNGIPIEIMVLGQFSGYHLPASDFNAIQGWNIFNTNANVTTENYFRVGYRQTQANWPQLSTDTTWPHSEQSWWHNGSAWVAETGLDYAIAVEVKYEVISNSKQKQIVTEWLSGSASADVPRITQETSALK